MSRIAHLLIIVLLSAIGLAGCSDSGEVELTGDSAFDYIRKDLSMAPPTDVESIRQIMDWAVDDYLSAKLRPGEVRSKSTDSSRVEPDDGLMRILKKTTKPRKNIATDDFERVDFSIFADSSEPLDDAARKARFKVNLSELQSEFYVDHLDAIPVRNQGRRGTCAAFTGVAQIEYATLKSFGSLPTMDLSEQRFYYLSKPECHSSGCSLNEEGSWYGTGMEGSLEASDLDIPLEADCPYNSQRGDNDLQTPQIGSCSTGAVKVAQLQYVKGADQIIKALHETKLPVPFASPLSSNWERNDGLITYADSGHTGDTSHAAGHAYLIVGYKKLNNMADEGGMCFVIKNSWGTGWGVNGFSCMTLKWMEQWTFGYQLTHPMVMSVMLREDLQEADELPNNDEAEDESAPDTPDESEEDPNADTDKSDDEVEDEIDNLPEPDPYENLTWNEIRLFGPGESYYRSAYAEDGDKVFVRVIIRESSNITNPVELVKDSKKTGRLLYDNDRVGQIDDGVLYLCSGEYDLICSLRFSTEENKIYIEFPFPDNRLVDDEELPDGSWSGFDIPFGDYGVEVYQPDDLTWVVSNPKTFFRMKKENGTRTEPIRLSLDGTDIKAMGVNVGSLNPSKLGLCTGSFADACSVFAPGDELNILPSW